MDDLNFKEQVKAAIEFGEIRQLRQMLLLAKKRKDKNSIEELGKKLEETGHHEKAKKLRTRDPLSPERIQRIIDRYQSGDSLTRLAISFGIKKPAMIDLLRQNNVDIREGFAAIKEQRLDNLMTWLTSNTTLELVTRSTRSTGFYSFTCKKCGNIFDCPISIVKKRKEEACPFCFEGKRHYSMLQYKDKTFHSYKSLAEYLNISTESLIDKINKGWDSVKISRKGPETPKSQINIRLPEEYNQKLSEIHEYWSNKGEFTFLHSKSSGSNLLSSEASLAKSILQISLDSLYNDLVNERQIDSLALWICALRNENKKLYSFWKEVKPVDEPLWIKKSNWLPVDNKKFDEYATFLDSFKDQIFEKATKTWIEINKELFDLIWPVAVSRSHEMPDPCQEEDESTLALRMKLIKEKYGKN